MRQKDKRQIESEFADFKEDIELESTTKETGTAC